MTFELNMYHTCAIAVLVLISGEFVKRRVSVLQKFCIPVPVIGGLLFTLIITFGYLTNIFQIKFNNTLSDFFMLAFYASIGFTASIKLLKKGGIKVFKYLLIAVIVVILQNVVGVSVALLMNQDPLVGLATASIPMTGGHGTSAAFAPDLEAAGLTAATTIALAAATFGLVSGSLIGGPIGKFLVDKSKKRASITTKGSETTNITPELNAYEPFSEKNLMPAIYQLLLAMALGTVISDLLKMTGFTFPASVGAMLASAIFVNIADFVPKIKIKHSEINTLGNASLMLFLAMSMMTLKLWQLVDLAIPMIILLACQVILMAGCAIFITYPIMGRDYEAAIMASGHCGFGLGAVPTAMANMKTLTDKYGDAPQSFFIVPLVGSLFINFFNTMIITVFLNFVK